MNSRYTVNFTRGNFSDNPGPIKTAFKVEAESVDKALIECLSSCLRSGYRNVQINTVVTHFDGSW